MPDLWHHTTRTLTPLIKHGVIIPCAAATFLTHIHIIHTDKLARHQELSAREAALLRRKLSALLAAGGQGLVDLEAELTDVLLSSHDGGGGVVVGGNGFGSSGSGGDLRLSGDDQLLLRHIQGLQKQHHNHKQQQDTKGAGAAAGTAGTGTGTTPHHQLSPEGLLASALEDAEATLALLQGKLVATTSAAAAAEGRVAELQQRLAAAAVRRTREVASARAAGEVQLATLQDAVSRLGHREELAGQVGVRCLRAVFVLFVCFLGILN